MRWSFQALTALQRILRFRRAGGPDKFIFNVLRHTASTFLQNAGHSQWERDLILNHVGCGTTSDCSHGHALALKGELLRCYASGRITSKAWLPPQERSGSDRASPINGQGRVFAPGYRGA